MVAVEAGMPVFFISMICLHRHFFGGFKLYRGEWSGDGFAYWPSSSRRAVAFLRARAEIRWLTRPRETEQLSCI